MSSILCKNINLSKIFNFRLYNIFTRNYHLKHGMLFRNFSGSRRSCATAGFKYAVKKDSELQNKSERKDVSNIKSSLEKSLANIDWIVQQNGRVLIGEITHALNLADTKDASSTHGLYLLRSCKYVLSEPPSIRVELVNKIWNRFQEIGIQFDARHYNALLDIHISNSFKFNPTEILNSMEEQQIEPNKFTCLLLMKKYCKDGNIGGASEILEYMKEKGHPANEDVFNNLIEGHLVIKDFSGAIDLIEVMRCSNLKPSEETYTLLASGFAAVGDKNKMMSYLNGDQTNGMIISDKNHLKVIETLATSNNDVYIDDLLSMIRNPRDIRQELINSAIELIHMDCIDTAYKLASSSGDSQYDHGTIIFIKQLIKTKKPVSKIVNFCNDIFNKGTGNIIFLTALKAAINYGNIECAFGLLADQLIRGHPVRVRNILPLFSYLKENKASNEVWTILEKMYELGIPADFTTYIDYVYPALGVPNPQDVIKNIKRTHQGEQTAYDALFIYYCNLGKIDQALYLAEAVHISVSQHLDIKNLLEKYISTSDLKHLKVLNYILQNLELVGQPNQTEVLKGKYLATLIITKPAVFETLLKFETVTLSETALNVCEKLLMQQKPTALTQLRKIQNKSLQNNLTLDEEQQQLDYLKSEKPEYRLFLTERLFHHIRTKNIDRVSELLSIYEKNGFIHTPLMLAQLITLYSYAADLKKAKEAFSKLKDFPAFKLDLLHTFEYAAFLIKYSEFEETLQVLKDCLTEPYIISNRESASRNLRRLFAVACDTHNVDFVKNIQNLLMPLSKVIGSKNIYMDPLVNVHILRNDLSSAFEEYKNCLVNYSIPVCLNNLFRKCITANDKIVLQKIVDLTINYIGKNLTLLELSMAFIQTDSYSKAVSVIENLGIEACVEMLEKICVRMRQQGKLTELEQFICALKPLTHIDKTNLYLHLFKACKNKNDYVKAVEIFSKLTEDIKPNSEIVNCVSDLLLKNNQPIPSFIQSTISSGGEQSEVITKASESLVKYIEEESAEFVLDELNRLKKGIIRSLSSETLTNIVDLCLKKDCVKNLSSNTNVMTFIIENARDVLKPILEEYSAAGDIQKLVRLANYFPDFSLRNLGFNAHFAKAFINAGQPQDLLSHLEQCYNAKTKFFSITAFEELLKCPDLKDRVLQLSIKYLDVNFDVPIAVIWTHYFTQENYDKADEMFKIFTKTQRTFPVDRVDNQIIRVIRQNRNVDLGKKYISFVNNLNPRLRVKERAYGALLDALVLNGNYDEAVALVLESEKMQLPLYKHYQSTLLTLKSVLERENKTVPFSVPCEDIVPVYSSHSA